MGTAIIGFITKNWKWIVAVLAVGVLVFRLVSYGDERGTQRTTAIYADSLSQLRNALTRTDSMLISVRRDTLPRVVYRFRDRTVADSATLARLDSAVRSGATWRELAERMSPMASMPIDTTQYTPDSLEVRTFGQVMFDPFSRGWFVWIQSAPAITRTWLKRVGYILPPDVIEYPFSVELMLGSPVRSPALRANVNAWFRGYGLGIDLEPRHAPVFKGGVRWNF